MKNSGLCLGILLWPVLVVAGPRDIEALQNSQQEMQQRLQVLESNLQNQGLLEMAQMMERIQADLRELRGMVEQQSHELEGLRKRQRELYLDIDRRLNDLQLQGISAPIDSPANAGMPAAGAAATTAAATGDSDQERLAYKESFETLADGRHQQAIEAFNTFLQTYPNSKYADNAQYWLGEANYASRKFDQAIAEFQKVLQRFPRSSKVPDAKLKMGYTYYELQNWDKARSVLNDILNNHRNTSVAPLAEQRLVRMTKEGH